MRQLCVGDPSTASWRSQHAKPIACLLGIFLLANIFIVLGQRTATWDAADFYGPGYSLVADHARNFQLLLWNPWTNAGSPDGVDPQFGAFSPLTIGFGFLFGGSVAAFHAYWLFVWFLGGLGFYFLLNHFKIPAWGRVICACGFLFSGFLTGHASHTSLIHAFVALPWVIWRLEVGLDSRRLLPAAQAGAILGLAGLSGYPGVIFANCMLVGFWLAGRVCIASWKSECEGAESAGEKPSWLQRFWQVGLSGALLFAVSGVIMVPTYYGFMTESRGFSSRSGPLSREFVNTSNSLRSIYLSTIVSPQISMHPTDEANAWHGTDISSRNVYQGAIVVWLGLLALALQPRSKVRWWLFGMGVAFLALALSDSLPFRGWLYDLVSPSRYFRHSALFRGYFLFVTPILAAFACRDLQDRYFHENASLQRTSLDRLILFSTFVAPLAIAAYVAAVWVIPDHPKRLPGDLHMVLVWLSLPVMAGCWFRSKSSERHLQFRKWLVLCCLVDLTASMGIVRRVVSAKASNVHDANIIAQHRNTTLDLLKTGLERKAKGPFAYDLNSRNLEIKLPLLGGYQPLSNEFHLQTKNDSHLQTLATGAQRIWFAKTDDALMVPPTTQAFDAYRASAKETQSTHLLLHSPAAMRAVGRLDSVTNDAAENLAERLSELPPCELADVQLQVYEPNRLAFSIDAQAPGWVLVTDRWAPGWTAKVNGISQVVHGGNFIFRAVAVPAGKSVVSFQYSPAGFPWLLMASWGAMGVVLFGSIIQARKARKTTHDLAGLTSQGIAPETSPVRRTAA